MLELSRIPLEIKLASLRLFDHPIFDVDLGLATEDCREQTHDALLWEDLINSAFVSHEGAFLDIDMIAFGKFKFDFGDFFGCLRVVQHLVDFVIGHRGWFAGSTNEITYACCFLDEEKDVLGDAAIDKFHLDEDVSRIQLCLGDFHLI